MFAECIGTSAEGRPLTADESGADRQAISGGYVSLS